MNDEGIEEIQANQQPQEESKVNQQPQDDSLDISRCNIARVFKTERQYLDLITFIDESLIADQRHLLYIASYDLINSTIPESIFMYGLPTWTKEYCKNRKL